jgi:RNA polymerase sigma factor (sigma-70 family)
MSFAATMTGVSETAQGALSQEDFSRIVSRHQRAVCAVAYSALGDRAASEEVAQEAFLLAWQKLPGLAEPPKLPAWICGIARNLARNARRSAGRAEPCDTLDTTASPERSPLDDMLETESQTLVRRALDQLPDSYREPLVLFYRQDQSIREVAAALDITEPAAKQRLSRGREKLQAELCSLIERTLRSSGPGAAFTATVMAAVAAAPAPAHAAGPHAVASTAAAAKPGASLGMLGLLGGGLAIAIATASLALIGSSPSSEEPAVSSVALATEPTVTAAQVAPPTPPIPGRHYRPLEQSAASASTPSGDPLDQEEPNAISTELADRLSRQLEVELNQASVTNVLRLLGEAGGVEVIVRGDIASEVTFDLRASTVQEALDETLDQAAAVWSEVSMVKVTKGTSPAGPLLSSGAIDLRLVDADFAEVVVALGEVLDMPVSIEAGLNPPPVTIDVEDEDAGVALHRVVSGAGLRYQVVPAIEVRPEEDVELDWADPRP